MAGILLPATVSKGKEGVSKIGIAGCVARAEGTPPHPRRPSFQSHGRCVRALVRPKQLPELSQTPRVGSASP